MSDRASLTTIIVDMNFCNTGVWLILGTIVVYGFTILLQWMLYVVAHVSSNNAGWIFAIYLMEFSLILMFGCCHDTLYRYLGQGSATASIWTYLFGAYAVGLFVLPGLCGYQGWTT